MENKIIQDYGKTIAAQEYKDILQGHQYIPQADQCIKNIVKNHCEQKELEHRATIIDLGCGPGRLTEDLGRINSYRVGLDISANFIRHAEFKKNLMAGIATKYQCADFLLGDPIYTEKGKTDKFDVIVMQGVMHHIHGDDRIKWLQKCKNLLADDGILVIGDEFIRDYIDEDHRKVYVAQFYCHIIAEALKGGFRDLAKEEAKNLIDDAFSGTKYAGHANEETFALIYDIATRINTNYQENGTLRYDAWCLIEDLFSDIKAGIDNDDLTNQINFNRGDYKISIPLFIEELRTYDFLITEEYKIGPVEHLGGMGVLVFKKK